MTLQTPKPSAPFRSLLDPDFTYGTPEQGCEFTNFTFNYSTPNRPKPPKVVNVSLEVRYSSTPDAHAVDEARKQVDTRTYDHPTDLPGLGDAAFWIGAPNNVTLFVFLGGTTRLMIGPSEIGLEQEKALAAKAVAALGKTTFTYGAQPTGLNKPVLGKPGPNPSALDQLKRALTAKADTGDAKAQLALGQTLSIRHPRPRRNARNTTTPAPPTGITRHRITVTLRRPTNSQSFIAMDWACLLTRRSHSSFCKKPPKPTMCRRCRCCPMLTPGKKLR